MQGALTVSRRRRLSVLVGVIVPVASYLILADVFHSALAALAVTEAIPVVWVLVSGLRRGRVDPLALAIGVVLALAIAVSLASGGSTLPLKLRRAVITGSFGIAFVGSVLAGRPLLPVFMDWLARAWPQTARLAAFLGGTGGGSGADAERAGGSGVRSAGLTLIVGLTLLSDAAAQVTLAFTLSTAAFIGVSRLARIAIVTVGLTACGIYLRRRAPRATVPPEPPEMGT